MSPAAFLSHPALITLASTDHHLITGLSTVSQWLSRVKEPIAQIPNAVSQLLPWVETWETWNKRLLQFPSSMKCEWSEKNSLIPVLCPSSLWSKQWTPNLLPPRIFLVSIRYFKSPCPTSYSSIQLLVIYCSLLTHLPSPSFGSSATSILLNMQKTRRPLSIIHNCFGMSLFCIPWHCISFPDWILNYNSAGTYLQGLQYKAHNWSHLLEVEH